MFRLCFRTTVVMLMMTLQGFLVLTYLLVIIKSDGTCLDTPVDLSSLFSL